jgi:acyl phosphate:glycerol-3-phosphate acyltransferase
VSGGQAALVVGAYLLGSMPWGYWLVRVLRHADIRATGSGNTGATNVWRTYGPRLGVPVLLLDMLKGFAPALVGVLAYGDGTGAAAGAAAMAGHTFPIFLGLGGGKGVATGSGALLALAPESFAIAAVAFLALLWTFRFVSLASLAGALVLLAGTLVFGESWPVVAFAAAGGLAVAVRHRANIARLRAGTEPRVQSFGRGRLSPR